jgi:hypothetical protein
LNRILEEGQAGLYSYATERGFRSDPEGYISPCHLCGHIRTWMYHSLPAGERPPELAPGFFYEEMGRLFPRAVR